MGTLFCMATNLIIGVRLLWLAKKTRKLPEFTLGTSVILAGAIGWTALLISREISASDPAAAEFLLAMGTLITNLGNVTLLVFIWRVYRPYSTRTVYVIVILVVMMAVSTIYNSIIVGKTYAGPSEPIQWLGMSARLATYFWGTLEAFVFWRKLKRRALIGLAEPVVANRVFMWGVATATAFMTTVIATSSYIRRATGYTNLEMFIFSALGFAGAFCTWLAFWPPARYLKWIESSASKTEVEDG